MRFRTKMGSEFNLGEFFRKEKGTYVYMVNAVPAGQSNKGSGVSFNGVSTQIYAVVKYVECSYSEFVDQVEKFNTSGLTPELMHPANSCTGLSTKIQTMIEYVEAIPEIMRLAKACAKIKKQLDGLS